MVSNYLKGKDMQMFKFKDQELIREENRLFTPYQKANDLQSWAIVEEDGNIFRYHENVGKESELIKIKSITVKELKSLKLKTKDASFKDLCGETISSFEEDEKPLVFWGDQNERYVIVCKSGRKFIMETGGGSNLLGFPGSQSHVVWLQEVI